MLLEDDPETLGEPTEWQAEWKWDGIRGQIIKRNNELFVWSRGEELMTEKFPEYYILKDLLPDGVVIRWRNNSWLLNGKAFTFCCFANTDRQKKYYQETITGSADWFFCLDLLEYKGEDWRDKPLEERRNKLEEIIQTYANILLFNFHPVIDFN